MADFKIFGVVSQRDATLESMFPSLKEGAKSASTAGRIGENDSLLPIQNQYEKSKQRVWVDLQAVKELKEEFNLYLSNKSEASRLSLPLNFGSVEDEIGFAFVMEALSFASCFDRTLEAKTRSKRGARDTVQFGLIAMFISDKPPHTADNLINCSSNHEISTMFDFPIHESQALDFAKFGGVYKDVDGPLAALATSIGKSMTEMGVLLRSRQLNHLGEFAITLFAQVKDKNAWTFCKELAKALPYTFGDNSGGIPFLSKAQRVTSMLHERFPDRFPFEQMESLLGFSDAEMVFALRKLGTLKLDKDLEALIDAETENKLGRGGKDEIALRVAAIQAIHSIVESKTVSATRACQWVIDKGINIVHPTMRHHLCDTTAY